MVLVMMATMVAHFPLHPPPRPEQTHLRLLFLSLIAELSV